MRRSIRIRGLIAWARWVENPTASRKSVGTTHWPVRPRVSPNASTAFTPPRRIRSLAIPCTIIRPSPPPRCSGATWAVVRITASALIGAVANPSAAGTCTGGAQIRWPTTSPSTIATRPHDPHSRSTIETHAAFSSAS